MKQPGALILLLNVVKLFSFSVDVIVVYGRHFVSMTWKTSSMNVRNVKNSWQNTNNSGFFNEGGQNEREDNLCCFSTS